MSISKLTCTHVLNIKALVVVYQYLEDVIILEKIHIFFWIAPQDGGWDPLSDPSKFKSRDDLQGYVGLMGQAEFSVVTKNRTASLRQTSSQWDEVYFLIKDLFWWGMTSPDIQGWIDTWEDYVFSVRSTLFRKEIRAFQNESWPF